MWFRMMDTSRHSRSERLRRSPNRRTRRWITIKCTRPTVTLHDPVTPESNRERTR